jgi:hypothetical protein
LPWLGQVPERAVEPFRNLRLPADLIDLGDWYLPLRTGDEGDPDDVYPPTLRSYRGVGPGSTAG